MSADPPKGGSLSQVEGIDRVAAPLAHELGQTVAVIGGAVSMLRAGGGADPNALEFLDHEAERLRVLTDELLLLTTGQRS
jgi:signal transduction histidine kinase